jgi:hypothetical protein
VARGPASRVDRVPAPALLPARHAARRRAAGDDASDRGTDPTLGVGGAVRGQPRDCRRTSTVARSHAPGAHRLPAADRPEHGPAPVPVRSPARDIPSPRVGAARARDQRGRGRDRPAGLALGGRSVRRAADAPLRRRPRIRAQPVTAPPSPRTSRTAERRSPYRSPALEKPNGGCCSGGLRRMRAIAPTATTTSSFSFPCGRNVTKP